MRVRAGARALGARDVRALASLAERHGNGLIELTRRANLQLRGVTAASLEPLQRALVELGLIDPEPARERRLSCLIADPLAGVTGDRADLAPLVRQLERALEADCALPEGAKLTIAVAGSRRALAFLTADIHLAVAGDAQRVELRVGSDRGLVALGVCAAERAVALTLALLERAAQARVERVRELVAQQGVAALRAAFPELASIPLTEAASVDASARVGFYAEQQAWLGLALPFGSGTSEQWRAVAELAERFGGGSVRVSPERVVLLPGVQRTQRAELLELASEHGFILSADDPRLRITACVGAPRCSSAWGETRMLAASLAQAQVAEAGRTMHVSGCSKGCAASGTASIVLVHAQDGCKLGFESDLSRTLESPSLTVETVRERLASRFTESKVSPPMRPSYEYERDPAAIYRRSFAIIREEADLARFSPAEERVAVRLIHTSGSVDLAEHVLFSRGFAEAAQRAIRGGAPILCDANMIVSGVTRSRLAAGNELLCFLDHPATAVVAREQRTTRSAAALTLWRERLDGAVVAIGNAPTALFRLLELLDETAARPAAIIGLPVGFVGAVESKETLLADGRVPAMIVRGRRGGSALAVAAINALARDEE